MPLQYARRLSSRQRSVQADRHLGVALTFVAGATNAGAFLAVHQYTSHMTGILSAMADHLVLGMWDVVAAGLGALLAFTAGAACSALLVNLGRRHQLHSEFAGPLLLEAALLLAFGLLGSRLAELRSYFVPLTVMLLCFTMGLQNALVTKLSRAEIRTTHVTGIVTDIGIELGKLAYWNRSRSLDGVLRVEANRDRLGLLGLLLLSFFCGGVAGAWGFNRHGYVATVPLAALLGAVAVPTAWDDVVGWWRRHRKA
ncbi:YoaK family protein [Rhizobacter sp. SG703]|uniref:YoaK family protein n=1 Tax=Rhizobacter sp. SG703 TaxID=2587140 RepID=UPI0014451220|nr:YoaK family protein [Rhizobacter sp. SG703]NKI94188.1 uncharacterized membrane protein YoaK (UPF0700 family) [Rhizobacter sp. SG703]